MRFLKNQNLVVILIPTCREKHLSIEIVQKRRSFDSSAKDAESLRMTIRGDFQESLHGVQKMIAAYRYRLFLMFVIVMLQSISVVVVHGSTEFVVAKDGTGNYTTIQAALDAVPVDHQEDIIIIVKKGLYQEKLFITKSHIAIVGEDRDSTRIVFAELRKNWNAEHTGSDWGSAVINIDSTVADITLANLTVHNNYGSLYGSHDHQFAIRGGGTRIIIIECNVIADGGDTVSLWNKKDGMYYHANCTFEGWVDYVCPRGWCYITDSRFFGHNLSASIWHDGDSDPDQKFVIRDSYFDGVSGFSLGRNHRDGQIYLLGCLFSKALADTPIYWPTTSRTIWKWGARHYYFNCHREGGDYSWFKNNLFQAKGSPAAEEITARWTFDGRWNPEEMMPAVLPTVSFPRPKNASYGIDTTKMLLKWTPSRKAVSYNIFFGKAGKLEFKGNQSINKYHCGKLEADTRYVWRVDEVTKKDTVQGPEWHFTTR